MNTINGIFDRSQMERFDASKKEVAKTIRIQDKGISLPAVEEFSPGSEVVVYVSKDGKDILFETGKGGFPVKATGRGGSGRKIICPMVISFLKQKNIEIPQSVELRTETDRNNGGRSARLVVRGE